MACSSEFVAYLTAGVILEKLGAKTSLITCYLIAAFGGILMVIYGLDHPDSISFPIIFLICRFGISGVYILFIAANARIFDVERSATAFGLGSFFARMILSGAPLASTLSQPLPMYIFCACTLFSAFTTCFVQVHPATELRRNQAKWSEASLKEHDSPQSSKMSHIYIDWLAQKRRTP